MSRDPCERLDDILEQIDRALAAEQLYVDALANKDASVAQVAFDAILYNLVVIGEAIKALPEAYRTAQPDVHWSAAAGMRDFLAHQYFRIEAEVIRNTLDAPLEELRRACATLHDEHC